ncbi:MAG: N-6 DNA methylase, partial [Chloroflexi bacterium]|nr:N-6 DNA methylase [Chloroflexota bacterium]
MATPRQERYIYSLLAQQGFAHDPKSLVGLAFTDLPYTEGARERGRTVSAWLGSLQTSEAARLIEALKGGAKPAPIPRAAQRADEPPAQAQPVDDGTGAAPVRSADSGGRGPRIREIIETSDALRELGYYDRSSHDATLNRSYDEFVDTRIGDYDQTVNDWLQSLSMKQIESLRNHLQEQVRTAQSPTNEGALLRRQIDDRRREFGQVDEYDDDDDEDEDEGYGGAAALRDISAGIRTPAAAPSPPSVDLNEEGYPSSAAARWDANIRAIGIIKELERDGRRPTPEEQAALRLYSGFGDSEFKGAIERRRALSPAWQQRSDALQELVTDEEMKSLLKSTQTAFYTPKHIVQAMWQGIEDLGAADAAQLKVLEPSAGSGRFLDLQPAHLAEKSERTAIERDDLTGRILAAAHPDDRVYGAAFEESPVEDNAYDIAISNIPFGTQNVYDPGYVTTKRKFLTRGVHNYFFAKALDKVKPGGVIAFITTSGMMNSAHNTPVRRYLSERADLLGAVRLPQQAFDDTDVTTDIVYLRKRAPGSGPGDQSWVGTSPKQLQFNRRPVAVNDYFHENPDKVLGREVLDRGQYNADEYAVTDYAGTHREKIRPELAETLAGERAFIAQATPAGADPPPRSQGRTVEAMPAPDAPEVSDRDRQRYADLTAVRSAARELLNAENDGSEYEAVEARRSALRERYAEYYDRHEEALNSPNSRRLLDGTHPDDALVFALEQYNTSTDCWEQSDIFTERQIGAVRDAQASDARDAMRLAFHETASLDFDYMGQVLDREPADVRRELLDGELIYRTPANTYVSAEEYLSGDVRAKLRAARAAAQRDPEMLGNVRALEKVQPEWLTSSDIRVPFGASWVPASVVNRFISDVILEAPGRHQEWVTHYEFNPEAMVVTETDEEGKTRTSTMGTGNDGGWQVVQGFGGTKRFPTTADITWGVGGKKTAEDLVMAALRGTSIDIKDSETKKTDPALTQEAHQKVAEIKQAFADWVWNDEGRTATLETSYNERHNATVPREYDGSQRVYPNMAEKWQRQLRPHQREAIERVVQDGTTLLAHEVGFGKTATMIGAAQERKRLGLANKPVFVVPKATHEQFQQQFRDLYPGARILAPGKDDFTPGKRPRFIASIATGDWDGVVLTYEQFQSIPTSPETQAQFVQEQIDDLKSVLDAGIDDKFSVKAMQKRLENLQTRMSYLKDEMASRTDRTVYFEDLGIDSLYVDEADNFKNLAYASAMGTVKGLPKSASKRSFDMLMKVRHLQDKAGERADGRFAEGGVGGGGRTAAGAAGPPPKNTTDADEKQKKRQHDLRN